MWNLNMPVVCINMRERPDRWKRVQTEFTKFNLTVDHFPGVHHKVGHIGCIQSHQECLNKYKDKGQFMVLEDDIKIIGTLTSLQKAYRQLPPYWDALYLGATLIKQLDKYAPNLYKLRGGLTTHAIIYNNQNGICDYIIENAYDENKSDKAQMVDVFMLSVQKQFNCFITYPMIMTQDEGFSDTVSSFVDYAIIERSYKKYTDGLLK